MTNKPVVEKLREGMKGGVSLLDSFVTLMKATNGADVEWDD
jgi:hypothetical protein